MGLLLGPSFIKLISPQDAQSLEVISELALAFIAFSIGSEFVIKDMKKYGKSLFIITLAQVIGAIVVVFSVMFLIFNKDFAFSIVIASMSAATAPAATLLVIRQYRADGPLTRTILPVVALDDILGIVAFGLAMPLARMSSSGIKPSFSTLVFDPIFEIVGSLVLGFIIGLLLSIVLKKLKGHENFQLTSLIAIGLGAGLAKLLGLSPLLTNIMIGMTLVNLLHKPDRAFNSINYFVPPFYVLFFTLAGATLDLSILKTVGLIGIAYVFARAIGKYLGSYIGAVSVKADKSITKYLGLALLPQGGVSIGLSLIVRQQLPEYATAITTIIMFSVLIYETLGPVFSKIAIQKAGEINGLDQVGHKKKLGKKSKIDTSTSTSIPEGSESK